MTKDDPDKPDAMPDVNESDIESLLEQTSELAAKAGEEVGTPARQSEADESDHPSAANDASDAEAVDRDDVDAKLSELEALLGEVSGSMTDDEQKKDAKPKADAETNQPEAEATTGGDTDRTAASKGSESVDDESDPEDYDDFDITVDLSDGDETAAEEEIAEKLGADDSEDADASGKEAAPLADRIVTAPIHAAAWLFATMDRPFVNTSPLTKQVIGYAALVTIAVSIGSMIYDSVTR